MSSAALDVGVQSWCFRNFKGAEEIGPRVRRMGVDKLELCEVHADFSQPEAVAAEVRKYHDLGISIVSLGVQTFENNADRERRWFESAQAVGAKHLSAHFKVDSFRDAVPAAAALADEFDMRIAIHCHGGYMFGGSIDILDHLLELGGPRIGVCLDTAWAMQIGPQRGNPIDWVRHFRDRLYGVHYKDFVFDRNAQWNDVVIGTGNLDLKGLVSALDDVGFDGFAVIEYEADVEDPVEPLTDCVKRLRSVG